MDGLIAESDFFEQIAIKSEGQLQIFIVCNRIPYFGTLFFYLRNPGRFVYTQKHQIDLRQKYTAVCLTWKKYSRKLKLTNDSSALYVH